MDAILKTQAEKLAREVSGQARPLRSMMKTALERMFNNEMEVHLGHRGVSEAADTVVAVA